MLTITQKIKLSVLFSKTLLFLFLFSVSVNVFAQGSFVSGKVTGPSGESLAGVSILVKGTSRGTSTDNNGNFSLNVTDPNATLIVSYVGFQTMEVNLAGQNTITVALVASGKQLDQVVVVGYGTQRKRDITGSSASVKGSEIVNIPALTATQAIQGKVAGVQITSSGAPGSAPNVRIRGCLLYTSDAADDLTRVDL